MQLIKVAIESSGEKREQIRACLESTELVGEGGLIGFGEDAIIREQGPNTLLFRISGGKIEKLLP